ncbi:hypothetical protein BASA81_003646 [Batrachochytrium salamandrivorans]|nr:hypothetical protein BASA81_003646 [Batrachochytrium salamandrivorans]
MRGIRTQGHDLAADELAGLQGIEMFDEAEVEQNIELQLEKRLGIDPKQILLGVQRESPLGFQPDLEMIQRMVRTTRMDIARLPNRSSTLEQVRARDELLIKMKFLNDMLAAKLSPIALPPKPAPPPPVAAAAAAARPAPKLPPVNVSLICPICKAHFQGQSKPTTKQYNLHLSSCLRQSKSGGGGKESDSEDDDGDGTGEEEEEGEEAKLAVAVEDDDYEVFAYETRMRAYNKRLAKWIGTYDEENGDSVREAERAFKHCDGDDSEEEAEEEEDDAPIEEPLHQVAPGLHCPVRLFTRLLPHQKEALPWLASHFDNDTGCILGDEMGLGKSCQTIAFLASLKASGKLDNPVLLVAPLTTLSQWTEELHNWHPAFKVVCLHESFGKGRAANAGKIAKQAFAPSNHHKSSDVLLITYQGLQNHCEALVRLNWSMVVLDEAHLIKNPDAKITITCKRLNTVHRLALTGSPIQNRLHELWSLFDFVAPRKLGTLPTFEFCFVEPIRVGGMFGATNVQVMAAFEQAKALRQSVTPHMLRRTKKQVATWLPEKTERVLFCKLTPPQREAYVEYIESDYVRNLTSSDYGVSGKSKSSGKAWKAITTLRKICNHPDLIAHHPPYRRRRSDGNEEDDEEEEEVRDFDLAKSSKMQVLVKILTEWRQHGDKVLVFCQGTKMLSVLEAFAEDRAWPSLRMDGSTPAKQRQRLIHRFNHGPVQSTFLFLLTTRVGGIGINLTGANKVIIFDPDWNPSTDSQARERAWRLGQTRPVTVYRLIVSGTIEEKIYHRQIFKQFLTNKVLDNPSQRRFFKESDLKDLFTLTEGDGGGGNRLTDTASSFYQDKQEKERNEDEDGSAGADNAILKRLFHQDDDVFQEAFKQDVVESASKSQSERLLQEQFAKDAARRARKRFFAEEQAEIGRSKLAVNVPTYTGSNGPPPAAQSLLERMRRGASPQPGAAASTATATTGGDENPRHLRVFKRIKAFLAAKLDFQATSDELLAVGKQVMGEDPNGPAVFRELLRDLATFNEQTKKWKLKPKFQRLTSN